jgi:hypothetical protein
MTPMSLNLILAPSQTVRAFNITVLYLPQRVTNYFIELLRDKIHRGNLFILSL